MTLKRVFPLWVLFVALLVAVGAGSLVGRLLDEQSAIATSAIAAIVGLLTGFLVLEIYDLYRRSRLKGYGPRIIIRFDAAKTLRSLVFGGLGVFVLLSLFHAVVVGSLGAGFRMTTEDIRLISTCPTHFKTHSEFVTREILEEAGLIWAGLVEGQTVYELVCSEGWDVQFQ